MPADTMSHVAGSLHDSIIRRRWVDAAATLQSEEGKQMAHDPFKDELPLHMALARRAPAALILDLIRAYPDGVATAGQNGNFPLHHACQLRCSPDIIMGLIKEYPEALDELNGQQCTPRYFRQLDLTSQRLIDRPTSCWVEQFEDEAREVSCREKIAKIREQKWTIGEMLNRQKELNEILQQKIDKYEPLAEGILNLTQLKPLQDRMEKIEADNNTKMEKLRRLVEGLEKRVHSNEGTVTVKEKREESRYQLDFAERSAESVRAMEEEVEDLKTDFQALREAILEKS